MKKWIILLLVVLLRCDVYAKEEPEELYAQSAVLMDADSGRVLFEKNGMEQRAMASTTKIMTCILTLELGDLDSVVTFSENASRQPKVHLGALEGEQFYLKDLLYSLMLESHNDSAVAIAEHIAGDTMKFADLMNQKAKEIGCENTYYITPNGLDASDEHGKHSTTAVDLAKIMSYCIEKSVQKDKFLEITSTMQYGFSNLDGNKSYTCTNHNSFLNMMDEAISGKTGYTSEAGYCYVGAVESENRTFVVSLLACGWPNNKNYKWADMKKIVSYGMENYEITTIDELPETEAIPVIDGIPVTNRLFDEATVETKIVLKDTVKLLMHRDEELDYEIVQPDEVQAPVEANEKLGEVIYYLNGEPITVYEIVSEDAVKQKDFEWYFKKIFELYTMKL